MKPSLIVGISFIAASMTGCQAPYVLKQQSAFSKTTNEFVSTMKDERTRAVALKRTGNSLATLDTGPTFRMPAALPGDDQIGPAFVKVICEHDYYGVSAGLGLMAQHSEALVGIAEAPSGDTAGAAIGGIRASLAVIRDMQTPTEGPSKKVDPKEKCKQFVTADLQSITNPGVRALAIPGAAEFDFVFALEKLITGILSAAEQELRGQAVSTYAKKFEPSIKAAFFSLACPSNYDETGQRLVGGGADKLAAASDARANAPGRDTKPNEGRISAKGCGLETEKSRLNEMLIEARRSTLAKAYVEYKAILQLPTPGWKEVLERRKVAEGLAQTLQNYDGYRRFANIDGPDDLLANLHKAIWSAVEGMAKGPQKAEDYLDAALSALHTVEAILKDRADFIEKRAAK